LGGVDLTSPEEKMTMQVIAAVAEFERDLLLEKTHSGIKRARAAGKRFGHPPVLDAAQERSILQRIEPRVSVSSTIKIYF